MRLYDRLQPFVLNEIPAVSNAMVTAVIGDSPSTYSKTPRLWNALYRDLKWDAVSLAWDVAPGALAGFLAAARGCPELAGFNVTNPHKVAVVPLLDHVDADARQIGAVNTVVRTPDGQLVGSNTDGHGAAAALTGDLPGEGEPFMPALDDCRILIIGAGGAARAIAFTVAPLAGAGGMVVIANRDAAAARSIADALASQSTPTEGGGESLIGDHISSMDLIVNCSSKGQQGWRVGNDGSAHTLEPYSALGPCAPAPLPPGAHRDPDAATRFAELNAADLDRNRAAAAALTAALRPGARCFDVVYAPEETQFLADARRAGHPTRNGRWMIIAQAAAAFAEAIGAAELGRRGLDRDAAYIRALIIMARAW